MDGTDCGTNKVNMLKHYVKSTMHFSAVKVEHVFKGVKTYKMIALMSTKITVENLPSNLDEKHASPGILDKFVVRLVNHMLRIKTMPKNE